MHGYPPFNDESPDKVFENIVQHRLHFPEPDAISSDAMDFIEQLLTVDPTARLGYGGADEVKAHPFLAPIDWDRLFKDEPSFVPRLDDPEATDYFDPRGATELVFRDEDDTEEHGKTEAAPLHTSPRSKRIRDRSETAPAPPTVAADDFGTFNYKNLPVLERENEEVIRKLRGDSQTERASRHARHMSFAGPMRVRLVDYFDLSGEPDDIVAAPWTRFTGRIGFIWQLGGTSTRATPPRLVVCQSDCLGCRFAWPFEATFGASFAHADAQQRHGRRRRRSTAQLPASPTSAGPKCFVLWRRPAPGRRGGFAGGAARYAESRIRRNRLRD